MNEQDVINKLRKQLGKANVVRVSGGASRGYPDTLIFIAKKTYWLEIKIDDTKLTGPQKKFQADARDVAGVLYVKDGKTEFHGRSEVLFYTVSTAVDQSMAWYCYE